MIVRLVHLTLKTDHISDFLQIFERSKQAIRSMPGCLGLTLIQDTERPECVSTLSRWTDEEALNAYRNSDFFKSTWAASKLTFRDRAHATSYTVLSTTD